MKEKRGFLLISLLLIIPLIKLVSALTIQDFFYAVGEEQLALILTGVVIGLIAWWGLSRAFGPEGRLPATVIAVALAIGGSYLSLQYGYARAIGEFIFGLGLNVGVGSDVMYPVIFVVALGLLILLTIITSISWALIILGVMMILLSSYAYESNIVTAIGVIMILAAVVIGWIRHRFQNTTYISGGLGAFGRRVARPGIFGWGRRRNP
ncbi:Uncharacterised protein [uncultured archaeon]|nr:Uncharacterised protein [uncultured archaeon]